jgi:hypothetical protein
LTQAAHKQQQQLMQTSLHDWLAWVQEQQHLKQAAAAAAVVIRRQTCDSLWSEGGTQHMATMALRQCALRQQHHSSSSSSREGALCGVYPHPHPLLCPLILSSHRSRSASVQQYRLPAPRTTLYLL